MSGIIGCIDPDGVDMERFREAARSCAYRGELEVALQTGTVAMGTLARPGEHRRTSSTGTSTLVLDGRVDAVIRARRVSDSKPGVSLLHAEIERNGADALNDFAAEFALASVRPVSGEMLLARDAFGLHPLYVAWRGRRFGFVSDPGVLVELGLATGDLDADVVVDYLAGCRPGDGRTAFQGVRELVPGTWLRVDVGGSSLEGRWFEPERLRGPVLRGSEAIEATQEAVTAAVISRAAGRRVGVSLSGGRDSGSVAVAAARAGIDAPGITQTFDADLPLREEHLARELCREHGLEWLSAPVPSCPDDAALAEVPEWSGTPLASVAPHAIAVVDVAVSSGLEVVLTGEGGEPLFTSWDIAVADLVRTGHPAAALRAARNFRSVWGRSYARQMKVAARAATPRALLAARERIRPVPPWVRGKAHRTLQIDAAPRSDRHALLTALVSPDPAGYDLEERLYQTRGVQPGYPLLDLRVVSVALSLDLADRAPITTPKPVLAGAFLGELAGSRVKMSFEPYFRRLATRMHRTYPGLFSRESCVARLGFIDPDGLWAIHEPDWLVDSLGIGVVELWLRRRV
jgi:asparagine synthetase B (glutamine-hydrolysing)